MFSKMCGLRILNYSDSKLPFDFLTSRKDIMQRHLVLCSDFSIPFDYWARSNPKTRTLTWKFNIHYATTYALFRYRYFTERFVVLALCQQEFSMRNSVKEKKFMQFLHIFIVNFLKVSAKSIHLQTNENDKKEGIELKPGNCLIQSKTLWIIAEWQWTICLQELLQESAVPLPPLSHATVDIVSEKNSLWQCVI